MAYSAIEEMIEAAEDHFNEGRYSLAEPLLNQIILKSNKRPEVFHMLGTIYYDQGKFNKAIRAFRRAIEIDPMFTDASVGLSIILNDLGKYDDARKVFEDAQKLLNMKNRQSDPYVDSKLALKHDELGELYLRYKRFEEALSQFEQAQKLAPRESNYKLHEIETLLQMDQTSKAIVKLKEFLQQNPNHLPARIKLGKAYYDTHRVPEAVDQWEQVLSYDPRNDTVKEYLSLANAVEYTRLTEDAEL